MASTRIRLLKDAIEKRQKLLDSGLELLRVFDRLGDGDASMTIDRYGPLLRFEFYEAVDVRHVQKLFHLAINAMKGASECFALERLGQGKVREVARLGQIPESNIVYERGRRYLVQVGNIHAAGTGVFVDQRSSRNWLSQNADGARVLNLFAHAGAFGVAALCGGARSVDHVDGARKSAEWASINYELNGFNARKHRFIVDDIDLVLKRLCRQKRQYDIIICDLPASFKGVKKNRKAFSQGALRFREYFDILQGLLARQGSLLIACNDRNLNLRVILSTFEKSIQRKIRTMNVGADCTSIETSLPATQGFWFDHC